MGLADVTLPTHIAHGTQDKDVKFTQAQQAAKMIPNAELYPVEGGCHLLALHARGDEMLDAQIAFIKKHQ